MKKRILCLALCLVLGLSLLPTGALAADGETSGNCGPLSSDRTGYQDNVKWYFQSDGTLLLDGTGATGNFGDGINGLSPAPWKHLADQITSIKVQGNITSLGTGLFIYCTNAKSVLIPASVEKISYGRDDVYSNSFPLSGKLEFILVDEGNEHFYSDGAVLYEKGENGTYTLAYYPPALTYQEYTVKTGTTTIANCAFLGQEYLRKITLNDEVTTIGTSAFSGCSALEELSIPYGVTSIGAFAFDGCTSLGELILPSSVTELDSTAITFCDALEKIIAPESLTKITLSSYLDSDCYISDFNLHRDWYFQGDAPTIDASDYDDWLNNDDYVSDNMANSYYAIVMGSLTNATFDPEEGTFSVTCIRTDIYYPEGASGWDELIETIGERDDIKFYPYTWEDDDTPLTFSVPKSSFSLPAETTMAPRATLIPANAPVTWTSSNTNVATVNKGGSVTGVSVGSAVITGTATYGGQTKTVSYKVNVTPGTSAKFARSALNLSIGDSAALSYTYYPNTADVTLYSSDSSVAFINGTKIDAVGTGTAVITISATANGITKTDTCTVTVGATSNQKAQQLADEALKYVGDTEKEFESHIGTAVPDKQWCAAFISLCARKIGAEDIIPYTAGTQSLFKKIVNQSGSSVCFSESDKKGFLEKATVVDRKSFTPKVGDIVGILWTGDSGCSHVAIVTDVNTQNKTMTIVDGNGGGIVKKRTNIPYTADTISGMTNISSCTLIGYATPNWSALQTSNSKRTDGYHCPIDVCYTYDGEVLDSATDQRTASFGTMTVEEDGSIIVAMNGCYDVDVVITGNGTGTMDLTSTFEAEDGATSTRTFQQVPISEDTVGHLIAYESADTEYLELYKKNGDEFVEVWSADEEETVTAADQELTELYINGETGGNETNQGTSSGNGAIATTTYNITPPDVSNGTITASPSSAARGDTVTLTAKPDAGYELSALTVTDANGKTISVTDKGNGTYTFTMPASKVSISASFTKVEEPSSLPFTDVAAGDWFYDNVAYVYDKGMMNGTAPTLFEPNSTTTRAMIVTILYRLEGEPAVSGSSVFTDVDAMAWTNAEGLVTGETPTTLVPQGNATRAQVATILMRFCENVAK